MIKVLPHCGRKRSGDLEKEMARGGTGRHSAGSCGSERMCSDRKAKRLRFGVAGEGGIYREFGERFAALENETDNGRWS